MAIASLIPGTDISVDRLDLAVDGWIEPNFRMRSSVGEDRVENGTRIQDHVVAMPDIIKLTGIVDSIRSPSDRVADCWAEVRKLHKEGAICRFVAEWGVWEEVVIVQANTIQTGRGMEFTLELQEINRIGLGDPVSTIGGASGLAGNPAANRQPVVETGSTEPVPVFLDSDGVLQEGFAAGPEGAPSGTDTIEIVEDDGTSTGRYTIPADGG